MMHSYFSRRRSAGMTLIEVMIALLLFAVLGTMTWRATSHLLDGRQRLDAALERVRDIDRALQIIETDLLQIVAPDSAGSLRRAALSVSQGAGGADLQFLRLAPEHGIERIRLVHSGEVLNWQRTDEQLLQVGSQVLRSASADDQDELLDGVRGVHWLFYDGNGWSDGWQPTGTNAARLPLAIELRLELADLGLITRVYALR